jgi:hypothetical protein
VVDSEEPIKDATLLQASPAFTAEQTSILTAPASENSNIIQNNAELDAESNKSDRRSSRKSLSRKSTRSSKLHPPIPVVDSEEPIKDATLLRASPASTAEQTSILTAPASQNSNNIQNDAELDAESRSSKHSSRMEGRPPRSKSAGTSKSGRGTSRLTDGVHESSRVKEVGDDTTIISASHQSNNSGDIPEKSAEHQLAEHLVKVLRESQVLDTKTGNKRHFGSLSSMFKNNEKKSSATTSKASEGRFGKHFAEPSLPEDVS